MQILSALFAEVELCPLAKMFSPPCPLGASFLPSYPREKCKICYEIIDIINSIYINDITNLQLNLQEGQCTIEGILNNQHGKKKGKWRDRDI